MDQAHTKIIFFGTADFAAVILNKLVEAKLSILGVVTKPDQPIGRKKILTPPLVKILAEKNKIPVFQPENLKIFKNDILPAADIFITADYGQIISKKILAMPKFGALNIHPSLLPKYRGPSPIQTALLNGDMETGVTIIKMDGKMDHGKIIKNKKLIINNEDTFITLSEKLAKIGAGLLIKIMPEYIADKIKSKKQNHKKATYTQMIRKEDGLINCDKTSGEIYNQWRAYIKWPGIFIKATKHQSNQPKKKISPGRKEEPSGVKIIEQENIIKLLQVAIHGNIMTKKNIASGKFFVENKKLLVKCGGETFLEILKLQPQDKKEMDAPSFINGYMAVYLSPAFLGNVKP
ncbi:methionyl-tRNA formyltransferase [Candidatus Kuenenbacteria bacterium CG11_big_fil_rev_8_21_14_0_20_37_9]|uniref:Methionyl-tRNA formyltransferase n=2 Tax=Candidatus Kueneniibacteriota TaxID=1752740 RepID=A0A2M6XS19_9BACT|nr:MAG: methionyl-tRNA formyltransferase [Candidatus Kuenenbacteria bacterium CG1_02_38_13]PIR05459.1 MAG: methionyl-tRNA formyltransferase [Candidatus Kuenenbacteria bacterium CG11_big_fil_rev_8_21_14_0_20_37_9]PIU10401.1 MAG: methionyl-tRNA formyltransferase [Candidatus Kuenenbacteria bacterium CG08_land_8_20_14_0_20_37_23]